MLSVLQVSKKHVSYTVRSAHVSFPHCEDRGRISSKVYISMEKDKHVFNYYREFLRLIDIDFFYLIFYIYLNLILN